MGPSKVLRVCIRYKRVSPSHAPYALKFGAATLAAHHFEDERLQAFTDQYAVFQSEIEDRALREDFSGPMRVQGAYSYQDHD